MSKQDDRTWVAFSHAMNHSWGTCLCGNRLSDTCILHFDTSDSAMLDPKNAGFKILTNLTAQSL